MLTNRTGTISRRGAWGENFEIYSPSGLTDPSLYVYKIRLWPAARGGGWGWSLGSSGLEAATDTNPDKLSFVPTARGGILSWLFSEADTRRLSPGAHSVSITAASASDPEDIREILIFIRVVR